MSLLGALFENPTTVRTGQEDTFGWNTSGVATRYLLITCPAGQMRCQGFGCDRRSRQALLTACEELSAEVPAKLLAIVTRDATSEVYDLDPQIARRRLLA
jgi:hypothetical protein